MVDGCSSSSSVKNSGFVCCVQVPMVLETHSMVTNQLQMLLMGTLVEELITDLALLQEPEVMDG